MRASRARFSVNPGSRAFFDSVYGHTFSEVTPCFCHPFIAPRALEPE
jgi:hypothetical protein